MTDISSDDLLFLFQNDGDKCLICACRVFLTSRNCKVVWSSHHSAKLTSEQGESWLIQGEYKYYHYNCDEVSDQGWGCGYRTLQTLCSWARSQLSGQEPPPVPSIRHIQDLLVQMEDKPRHFSGSRDWIGSVEACLVLDHLYEIPSKILHSRKGQLSQLTSALVKHFHDHGSPIMMGGDIDCTSKGIMGIHVCGEDAYLLVVMHCPCDFTHTGSTLLWAGNYKEPPPVPGLGEVAAYGRICGQLLLQHVSSSTSKTHMKGTKSYL